LTYATHFSQHFSIYNFPVCGIADFNNGAGLHIINQCIIFSIIPTAGGFKNSGGDGFFFCLRDCFYLLSEIGFKITGTFQGGLLDWLLNRLLLRFYRFLLFGSFRLGR
jgi:hypothetical protein